MTTAFYPAPTPPAQTIIYREIAMGLDAFNRLKHWQRYITAREGQRLSNGEMIDRLILAVPTPPVADTRQWRA